MALVRARVRAFLHQTAQFQSCWPFEASQKLASVYVFQIEPEKCYATITGRGSAKCRDLSVTSRSIICLCLALAFCNSRVRQFFFHLLLVYKYKNM